MGENVHLIGAEDVRSAGNSMRGAAEDIRSGASSVFSAAETMTRTARELDEALDRNRKFMTDWLQQFETVLRDHRNGRP